MHASLQSSLLELEQRLETCMILWAVVYSITNAINAGGDHGEKPEREGKNRW